MPFVLKHKPTVAPATNDYIYLAGFLDGEGCIRLVAHNKYKATRKLRHPSYHLRVGLTNRHLPVLEWVQARFGGSIHCKHRKSANHSVAFEYVLTAKDAVRQFVGGIAPYVKIKRPQVELAIAFLQLPPVKKIVIENRGKTWPLVSGDPAQMAHRASIVDEFTLLNRRGA